MKRLNTEGSLTDAIGLCCRLLDYEPDTIKSTLGTSGYDQLKYFPHAAIVTSPPTFLDQATLKKIVFGDK